MKILNMFEKEVQFIADININKLKTLGANITFEKLSNSDIHPALVKYISAEMDYRIFKDRQKLLEKSSFDYSGAKINEYFNLISNEIKLTKKIPADEIRKLVIRAVDFNSNYLIAPKNTLTEFIFNQNDNRNLFEIKLLFNFTYYYDYVRQVFFKYFAKQQMVSLSYNEFELIYSRIDNELYSARKRDLVDNVLDSIADFYNEGAVDKTRIPVSLIFPFLEEKNLADYLFKLKKKFPDPQLTASKRVDTDELKRIIFSSLPVEDEHKESFGVNPEESEGKPDIPEENFESHPDNIAGQKEAEIEPELVEKSKIDTFFDFEEINKMSEGKKLQRDETVSNPEKEEPEELEIKEDLSDAAIRAFEKNRDLSDESDEIDRKKNDPVTFLTNKDIEKITGAIFNDDRDDFSATIEKISECRTYEEATEVLKAVFFSYRVNPYSREAITFTNAVSNYFDQGK